MWKLKTIAIRNLDVQAHIALESAAGLLFIVGYSPGVICIVFVYFFLARLESCRGIVNCRLQ